MTDPLLRVRDLVVDYRLPRAGIRGHRQRLRAVDHVDFDIDHGEMLGLVGESGSGKSTIARAILGLAPTTAGDVIFDGKALTGDAGDRSRQSGNNIQVVFQNPYASLNPAHPIGDAIAEPLHVHRGLRGEALRSAVADLLRRVGLDPSMVGRRPAAFSGGQRQRIAIARAIALEPQMIIYDEAVSALDVSSRGTIINLMASLQRESNIAGLFIGHDLDIVRHVSSRIAVLYRGSIVEHGPAADVADDPRHPYTKRLVEAVLRPDPDARITRRPRPDTSRSIVTPIGCPFVTRCPERVDVCESTRPALEPVGVGDRAVACHVVTTVSIGRATRTLACIEVGGSGAQTVVFSGDSVDHHDSAFTPDGADVAIAVPGLIEHGRVVASSNLGWYDVDPAAELGLAGRPVVVANDAEAAALGEWHLRSEPPGLIAFVGLGTGVGGAVVSDGAVVAANLFAHQPGFSQRRCTCGNVGCLETVVGGWALPRRLSPGDLDVVATHVARAVADDGHAGAGDVLVVAGGLARNHPELVTAVALRLPDRLVQPTAAPAWAKSAAAWGLRELARMAPRQESRSS